MDNQVRYQSIRLGESKGVDFGFYAGSGHTAEQLYPQLPQPWKNEIKYTYYHLLTEPVIQFCCH